MEVSQDLLRYESTKLKPCPFCGQTAEFVTNKSGQLLIEHLPEAGVICPARYSQVCDNVEIGSSWWNTRK